MDSTNLQILTKEKSTSLSTAALISGIGILLMVLTVPFAEFNILPKLIGDTPAITTNNIINNKTQFTIAIFLYFITILCDVVVAWSLYVFLKPVNKGLSLLTGWFRLVYAVVYLIALANLLKVLNLLRFNEKFGILPTEEMYNSITFYIHSFRFEWVFGLIIFAIYLILLGVLVFKASYVPKVFGVLLVLAGLGYLIDSLRVFFFPDLDTSFVMITFFGELIFMGWLLVKGWRVKG